MFIRYAEELIGKVRSGEIVITSAEPVTFMERLLGHTEFAFHHDPGPTGLNPGVVKTVQFLNENGFKTTDSGDGKTHDFPCDQGRPYVVVRTEPEKLITEADRLKALLTAHGIPVDQVGYEREVSIQGSYDPVNGIALLQIDNLCDEVLG